VKLDLEPAPVRSLEPQRRVCRPTQMAGIHLYEPVDWLAPPRHNSLARRPSLEPLRGRASTLAPPRRRPRLAPARPLRPKTPRGIGRPDHRASAANAPVDAGRRPGAGSRLRLLHLGVPRCNARLPARRGRGHHACRKDTIASVTRAKRCGPRLMTHDGVDQHLHVH
jgi:hypothetical protein